MMPKSTATMRPASSTNRFPGCMSAWKNPSRRAWRRKVWITARAELRQVEPLGPQARHGWTGASPSIHSSVSTSFAVRSQSTAGTRKSGSSLVFSAISESAAASSRRSISSATERRKRRRRLDHAKALRLGRETLGVARREHEGILVDLEAALDAGPQHLDRDGLRPSGVSTSARCTCAIEAAATAGPKLAKTSIERKPESLLDRGFRFRLRKRRHLVLQAFQFARDRDADDVRPRRQKLAELHIGRSEPR